MFARPKYIKYIEGIRSFGEVITTAKQRLLEIISLSNAHNTFSSIDLCQDV